MADYRRRHLDALLNAYLSSDEEDEEDEIVPAPVYEYEDDNSHPEMIDRGGRFRDPMPSQDPLDIDASSFNVRRFLRSVLENAPVHELVRQCNVMDSEIKSLDSRMQMSVYENYSKFISATETIRQMRENVDSMDLQMKRLEERMNRIDVDCSRVAKNLGARPEQVEELGRSHDILKRVKYIFDLPNLIERSIDMGALKVAVEYFTSAQNILSVYKEELSLAKIVDECQKQVSRLVEELHKKMSLTSVEQEASDCVDLLSSLGEPISLVLRDYIDSRSQFIIRSDDRFSFDEKSSFPDMLSALVSDILSPIVRISRAVKSKEASFDSSLDGESDHSSLLEDLYLRFFRRLEGLFCSPRIPLFQSDDFDDFLEFITMYSSTRRQITSALSFLRDRIEADFYELFMRSVNRILELSFREARIHYANRIKKILSIVDGDAIQAECVASMNALVEELISIFSVFVKLAGSDDKYVSKIMSPMVDDVIRYVGNSLLPSSYRIPKSASVDAVSDHMIVPLSDRSDPRHFLIFAYLSISTSKIGVLALEEFTQSCEVKSVQEIILDRFRFQALSNNLMGDASSFLLDFIRLCGAQLSSMVKISFESSSPLSEKTPRAVRPTFVSLGRYLMEMQVVVASLFDKKDSAVLSEELNSVRKSHSLDFGSSSSGSKKVKASGKKLLRVVEKIMFEEQSSRSRDNYSLELDVDRLISKDLSTFSIQPPRASEVHSVSLVSEISLLVLKSLIECVRIHSFGESGFQQLQIDILYLTSVLGECTSSDRFDRARDLLLRALRCAESRCLDAQYLDRSIVEPIYRREIQGGSSF